MASDYIPLMQLWKLHSLSQPARWMTFASNPNYSRVDVRLLRATTVDKKTSVQGLLVDCLIEALAALRSDGDEPLKQDLLRVLAGMDFEDFKKVPDTNRQLLKELANILDTARVVGETCETAVVNGILLPSVRMICKEQSKDNFVSSGLETSELCNRIRTALSQAFNITTYREPLPINDKGRFIYSQRCDWELPWSPKDTACKAIVSIDNLIRFALHKGFVPRADDAEIVQRLFEELRDLAQVAWLTAWTIGQKSCPPSWERREVIALDTLFELERLLGNYVQAAYYAAFALHRSRSKNDRLQQEQYLYLRQMGLWTIDPPPPSEPNGGKIGAPSISGAASLLLRLRHPELFEKLRQKGCVWSGYGSRTIKWALDPAEANDSNLLRLIFEAAYLAGNFQGAANIFVKANKKNDAGEQPLSWNPTKREVLQFAEMLSSIQQDAVPLLDPVLQASYRNVLRRCWKRCEDGFSIEEQIFIHHCINNWAYLASDWDLARTVVHEAASNQIVSSMYSRFIDQVRHGAPVTRIIVDMMSPTSWRFARDDDVFVSLSTREGNTVNVVCVSATGCSKSLEIDATDVSSARYVVTLAGRTGRVRQLEAECNTDYHDMLKDLSKDAGDALWAAAADPDRDYLALPIPAPLFELPRRIADAALSVNPNVRRILLHAQPMWDALPWQFILSSQAEYLDDKLYRLRLAGQRAGAVGHYDGICIWRVPGLRAATSETASARAEGKTENIISDENDTMCNSLKNSIERLPDFNHITSFVFHGRQGSRITQLQLDGKFVDNEVLAKKILPASRKIALVHVCYVAAAAPRNAYINERGGLPGFFLAHGLEVLAAASVPVRHAAASLPLEQYLRAKPISLPKQIEEQYLLSLREKREVGLFTLYSSVMAPQFGMA